MVAHNGKACDFPRIYKQMMAAKCWPESITLFWDTLQAVKGTTAEPFKNTEGGKMDLSLTALCRRLEVPMHAGAAHDALNDTNALLALLQKSDAMRNLLTSNAKGFTTIDDIRAKVCTAGINEYSKLLGGELPEGDFKANQQYSPVTPRPPTGWAARGRYPCATHAPTLAHFSLLARAGTYQSSICRARLMMSPRA